MDERPDTNRERSCHPAGLHLPQRAGVHVVDKTAPAVLDGDERTRLDAGDAVAHVGVQVAERLGHPRWFDPGLDPDLLTKFVVGEGQHPAVGVVDEDDLLGTEQTLGDGE